MSAIIRLFDASVTKTCGRSSARVYPGGFGAEFASEEEIRALVEAMLKAVKKTHGLELTELFRLSAMKRL